MDSRRVASISKLLSLVLRHEPQAIGLTLDGDGWLSVENLLTALARHGRPLSLAELVSVVELNDKRRFSFSPDGSKIRANQGHSVAVDLGYEPALPPAVLYHGTVARHLDSIRAAGLRKGERNHVHLSASRELAVSVGCRRGSPVVLEVAATEMAREGHVFFCATNGVWLTSHVPPRFLRESNEVGS